MTTAAESVIRKLRTSAENTASNAAMYRKDFPGNPKAEVRAAESDAMSHLWTHLAKYAEIAFSTPDATGMAAGNLRSLIESKRRHLNSLYGTALHDLAEVEVLACDLRDLVALATLGLQVAELGGLNDEFGILDDGKTDPNAMPEANMRIGLDVRAQGVFALNGRRPARLMQRKATAWREIPGEGARGNDHTNPEPKEA